MALNETQIPHTFTLSDRKNLDLSGITEVEKFDDNIIVLKTDYGKLTVKGTEIKVLSLDVDSANKSVRLEGHFTSFEYSHGGRAKNESLAAKLFK